MTSKSVTESKVNSNNKLIGWMPVYDACVCFRLKNVSQRATFDFGFSDLAKPDLNKKIYKKYILLQEKKLKKVHNISNQ